MALDLHSDGMVAEFESRGQDILKVFVEQHCTTYDTEVAEIHAIFDSAGNNLNILGSRSSFSPPPPPPPSFTCFVALLCSTMLLCGTRHTCSIFLQTELFFTCLFVLGDTHTCYMKGWFAH